MYVTFSKDFKTKRTTDLALYLSPIAVGDLRDGNSIAHAVKIGPVSKYVGVQRIDWKNGRGPGKFKSIVLYSERISKIWAAAPLKPRTP